MSRSLIDHSRLKSAGRKKTQHGVVLIVAMIVLLAMTLAGYAMLRSVSSGMGIAGNLSFKQNATMAADAGVEEALKWIVNKDNTAKKKIRDATESPFFYPTWDVSFDPFSFIWDDTTSSTEISLAGGNRVRYVINRMCSLAGDLGSGGTPGSQKCVLVPKKYVVEATGCNPAEDPLCGTGNVVYYRVTARVQGPRDTVSYVQVLMF